MNIERLSALVITNNRNEVLLLHRTDHNQWQLPGGRIQEIAQGYYEDPTDTVVREASQELALDLDASQLQRIGGVVFSQGIVDYSCEWYRSHQKDLQPYLNEPETYRAFNYYDLHKYGVGRIGLSPNVERLKTKLQNDEIIL